MSNKIRIALADDHAILLQTLTDMLGREKDMEVVISAPNGKELLTELKSTKVDIVLLDLDMPIMDGRAVLPILKQYYTSTKIIILSFHDSLMHMRKFLSEGANAYMSKEVDFDVLLAAIRKVNAEGYYFCERVTRDFLNKFRESKQKSPKVLKGDPLSAREKEIVQLICKGRSNGEIALELSLSQRTIENHRMRLSKKIGTNSTAKIVIYAIEKGLFKVSL